MYEAYTNSFPGFSSAIILVCLGLLYVVFRIKNNNMCLSLILLGENFFYLECSNQFQTSISRN